MIVTLLISAAAANASIYGDFSKAWDAREHGYRSEREALDAQAKATADRAVEALVAEAPTAPDDLEMALTAAYALSELIGRGQTLSELRVHMDSRPSAALSEVWLQGKVDEVRRRSADADVIEAQIDVLKDRDSTSVAQWIAALERLSQIRGTLAGTSAELELIQQNLTSYYRARNEDPAGSMASMRQLFQALGDAARQSQAELQKRSAECARDVETCGGE